MTEPNNAPQHAVANLLSKIQYLCCLMILTLWPHVVSAQVVPPEFPRNMSDADMAVQLEYQKSYLEYTKSVQTSLLAEGVIRQKAFEQQQYAGWVVLILVALMTFGGFAFSLTLILKAASLPGNQPVSDLEVTLQRIKLSSIQTASLVGLVVYLSSLGFLYLYMRQISGIAEVVTESTKLQPGSASTNSSAPIKVE
jgi:hypothetical protein